MDINRMRHNLNVKLNIYKAIIGLYKFIDESGYKTFTASMLFSAYNLSYKGVSYIIKGLICNKYIEEKYRVYNPDDSSEYHDFSNKKDIPFGGCVDYPNTGNHFYVSKYNARLGIYYEFTHKGLQRCKSEMHQLKRHTVEGDDKSKLKHIDTDDINTNYKFANTPAGSSKVIKNITNNYIINERKQQTNMSEPSFINKGNAGYMGTGNVKHNEMNINKYDHYFDKLRDQLSDTKYKDDVDKAQKSAKVGKFSKVINFLKDIPKDVITTNTALRAYRALKEYFHFKY